MSGPFAAVMDQTFRSDQMTQEGDDKVYHPRSVLCKIWRCRYVKTQLNVNYLLCRRQHTYEGGTQKFPELLQKFIENIRTSFKL
jgi:hypothetical protein